MTEAVGKGTGLTWFVRRTCSVRGPFSSAKVRHFVLEGRLQLDDEVSPDQRDWRPLGSVAEVVPLELRADPGELARREAELRRGDRWRVLRAGLVVSVLIVGLVWLVLQVGSSDPGPERDCAAPPSAGVDLEGCRLSGRDLSAADLAGARLLNAVLDGSRLAGANLEGAVLRYANLAAADLSYARLRGADLTGADLRRADLTNADLSGADLRHADLGGARPGGARFDGARLDGALWVDGRACAAADCPR
jgi:hypothetical protein